MPTVVEYRGIKFVVHPNDHNPPHVHVKLSSGAECRINLESGDFMDTPPAGTQRAILRMYRDNVEEIVGKWEEYHPDQ